MKTIAQLKKEIDDSTLDIPNEEGYYMIYTPSDFIIRIREDTDAIDTYQGRSLLYPISILEKKLSDISLIKDDDKYLFYIGKADKSNGRGLKKRISEFVNYGYGACNNHRGGRAIWQIANNKELLLDYIVCQNAAQTESFLLMTYREKHNTYPFANWKN